MCDIPVVFTSNNDETTGCGAIKTLKTLSKQVCDSMDISINKENSSRVGAKYDDIQPENLSMTHKEFLHETTHKKVLHETKIEDKQNKNVEPCKGSEKCILEGSVIDIQSNITENKKDGHNTIMKEQAENEIVLTGLDTSRDKNDNTMITEFTSESKSEKDSMNIQNITPDSLDAVLYVCTTNTSYNDNHVNELTEKENCIQNNEGFENITTGTEVSDYVDTLHESENDKFPCDNVQVKSLDSPKNVVPDHSIAESTIEGSEAVPSDIKCETVMNCQIKDEDVLISPISPKSLTDDQDEIKDQNVQNTKNLPFDKENCVGKNNNTEFDMSLSNINNMTENNCVNRTSPHDIKLTVSSQVDKNFERQNCDNVCEILSNCDQDVNKEEIKQDFVIKTTDSNVLLNDKVNSKLNIVNYNNNMTGNNITNKDISIEHERGEQGIVNMSREYTENTQQEILDDKLLTVEIETCSDNQNIDEFKLQLKDMNTSKNEDITCEQSLVEANSNKEFSETFIYEDTLDMVLDDLEEDRSQKYIYKDNTWKMISKERKSMTIKEDIGDSCLSDNPDNVCSESELVTKSFMNKSDMESSSSIGDTASENTLIKEDVGSPSCEKVNRNETEFNNQQLEAINSEEIIRKHNLTSDNCGGKDTTDKTVILEHKSSKNTTDKAVISADNCPENVTEETVTSEDKCSEDASDKLVTSEDKCNEDASDKLVTSDKCSEDVSDKLVTSDDKCSEDVSDKLVTSEDICSEYTTDKTVVSEDKCSENTTDKTVISEDKISDDTSEKTVISKDKCSENTIDKKVISEDKCIEDTFEGKVISKVKYPRNDSSSRANEEISKNVNNFEESSDNCKCDFELSKHEESNCLKLKEEFQSHNTNSSSRSKVFILRHHSDLDNTILKSKNEVKTDEQQNDSLERSSESDSNSSIQDLENDKNTSSSPEFSHLLRKKSSKRSFIVKDNRGRCSFDIPEYEEVVYTQDHELQQKIDFEIKMRDGTAKLLAASRHPAQLLEAAKNLLTSNTRMIAYMSELQKRKTDQVLQRNSSGEVPPVPCTATLSLSNLRVPLMWKDTDYFKNKGDHRRFAVFCLLKIGTEIYDTSLVKDVDRSMPDITFDDVIVFNNIPPDFELHLEVYSHRLSDDLSIASTPKKIKKKINEISTSVGRSVGRRLSGLREDPEFFGHMIVGPKFECIADATLTVDDVKDHISTYDLNFENPSIDAAHTELPLFGNFCGRISGKPHCMNEPIRAGSLCIKHSSGNEEEEYWATLKAGSLSCLSSSSSTDENEEDSSSLNIPVHKGTQVLKKMLKNGSCIELINKVQKGKTTHVLCSEDEEYLGNWYTALKQHIFDHESWKQVAEMNMHIEPSTPQKVPVFLRKSTHMYEGSAGDSPMTLVLKRLNMDPKADNSPSLSDHSAAVSAESNENSRPSAAKTPPVLKRKGKTKAAIHSTAAKETNC